MLTYYTDGVAFVTLAPLTASEQIIPAIAEACDFQLAPDSRTPHHQLLDYLRSKRLLLVLDNTEHLPEAASLVVDILQTASGVKVLATSRERLNLNGEIVYLLAGLTYPEVLTWANASDYSAVQLFIASAQRASARFNADNADKIVRICHLVQGMPLAIELAAAWVGALSLEEIADEIQRSGDFLQTTMRDVPERLRSVRAVFEAAWRRLHDEERRVFQRLSVFRGGFTREAAQAVAGADIAILAALVDKALVWWHSSQSRYEMHELLRQYAAQALEAAGEAEAVAEAHCRYFTAWVHEQALALKTTRHMAALERLDADVENIRAAFWRAIESGKPDAIEPFGDLWYYYDIRCWYLEGEKYFGSAISQLEPHESVALAKMIAAYTVCLHRLGRYKRLLELAQCSAEMLRRFGAERGNLLAFWYVGLAQSIPGDYDKSVAIYHEVLAMAQRHNDQWAVGILLYLLGQDAFNLRQNEQAKQYLAQSLTVLTDLNNAWGIPYPLFLLGQIAYLEQDYEEAVRLFETGLVHARQVRHPLMIEECLLGLVPVAIAKRELDWAEHLAEEVLDLRRDSGRLQGIMEAQVLTAQISTAAGNYGEASRRLREALLIASEVMPIYMLSPLLMGAELLLLRNKAEQAVEILSFFHQHPDNTAVFLPDSEKPQKMAAQAKTALLPEVYNAAWARGKTLTADALRTMLLLHL